MTQPPGAGWGGPPPGYYGAPPGYGYGPPPGYGYGYGPPYQPPRPGCVPLRPLGLSDILDGAFRVMRRNPRTVLGLSASVALVEAVISTVGLYFTVRALDDFTVSDTTGGVQFGGSAAGDLIQGIGFVVQLILGAVLTGMLTVVVTQDVLGRRLTLGETWRQVRPRLFRLLGLALITGIGAILGLVLCIAPGVWLWGVWAVAMPAFMVERLGVRASLGRSRALVTGTFWRVWGIRALGVLITSVVSSLITVPFLIFGVIGSLSGGSGDGPSIGFVILIGVGSLVGRTFTTPITAAIDALLYVDLRMRREGLDIALQQAVATPAGPVAAD